MDWSDERWVRLYTRDSGTWLSLKWEARAVLPQLMRKVERNGTLSVPAGIKPEAIVQKAIDFPVRVVRAGLTDLAAKDVIRVAPWGVTIVNFVPAQEPTARPKSGAERTKRWRERKGANNVTARDGVTEPVTRDALARQTNQPAIRTNHANQRAGAREGTATISAEGWRHDWQIYRWRPLVAELGADLPCPTSGAAKVEGVQRALDDFGPELVERVVEHEARAAAEHVRSRGERGRNPALFGRMFVGDGFAARLEDYRRETASSSPAEPEETPQQLLARLDAERGGAP